MSITFYMGKPGQGMSFSAARLNDAHDQVTAMMRRPHRIDDLRLYELSNRIRVEGLSLLSTSTLDLDFLAFLGREKAAGRTYSSQALAKQVFSQAGVVAPPESLNSEISPVSGKGSQNGL